MDRLERRARARDRGAPLSSWSALSELDAALVHLQDAATRIESAQAISNNTWGGQRLEHVKQEVLDAYAAIERIVRLNK